MKWTDVSAIAEALYEKYPDVDPEIGRAHV